MRFVLIVAGAFLFANGSTATTLADPQSRSGVLVKASSPNRHSDWGPRRHSASVSE